MAPWRHRRSLQSRRAADCRKRSMEGGEDPRLAEAARKQRERRQTLRKIGPAKKTRGLPSVCSRTNYSLETGHSVLGWLAVEPCLMGAAGAAISQSFPRSW